MHSTSGSGDPAIGTRTPQSVSGSQYTEVHQYTGSTPNPQCTTVSTSHLELLPTNLADVLSLEVDLDHALFFQLVGVSLPRHTGHFQGESPDT